jgi:hypothetical protein
MEMVRALELQQNILQTNTVEAIQHVKQQHSSIQQQYKELQFKEEKKLETETVQDSTESEKPGIRGKEDSETKQERQNNSKNNVLKDEKKRKKVEQTDMGRFIDIEV